MQERSLKEGLVNIVVKRIGLKCTILTITGPLMSCGSVECAMARYID